MTKRTKDTTPATVGDPVRVVSGPAYAGGFGGRTIRGTVVEVDGETAQVALLSGGVWGFMLRDLKVVGR